VCVLALFAICASAYSESEFEQQFLEFQFKYNRLYASKDEYDYRFGLFKENLMRASENQRKNPRARFGITKFSDYTESELKNLRGSKPELAKKQIALKDFTKPQVPHKIQVTPDQTNFDWGSAGVITPVYNQGQCGSCWAFSATETIESYWALAGHTLTSLSMQQITSCDTTCGGCGGGWPYLAYQYVQGAPGIENYASYPYTSGSGITGTCRFNSKNVVCSDDGYVSLAGEKGIYQQLSSAAGGPVSVCVDASSWDGYQGGILEFCGQQVDHCVQATGYYNYGASNQYWNVRNSWGADWGENGYIWIAIGRNLCDIGGYPTVVNVTSSSL